MSAPENTVAPPKTLPSILKEWFGQGYANHYTMRDGGYFWSKDYPALGLELWEGKDTRNGPYLRFWKMIGREERFVTNGELLYAYWLREGGAAYERACAEQGIDTPDPELLESPGLDWRALQQAERDRIEQLKIDAKAKREARQRHDSASYGCPID